MYLILTLQGVVLEAPQDGKGISTELGADGGGQAQLADSLQGQHMTCLLSHVSGSD